MHCLPTGQPLKNLVVLMAIRDFQCTFALLVSCVEINALKSEYNVYQSSPLAQEKFDHRPWTPLDGEPERVIFAFVDCIDSNVFRTQ
ncbi:hypothetical protein NUU61_001523 [Penicillium alfredii]|uniref:Uncharacterized protein n=1 Tax=Penicillium alfredii TaxID=1506179 RepID=A0A9W9G4G1_9EURO|nr:uncharacterized protein NUU61_001523 [Penicillium alfredii]KAJ5111893.1 hypothetical protein NUU61_001523 [Penicillium alfredii]